MATPDLKETVSFVLSCAGLCWCYLVIRKGGKMDVHEEAVDEVSAREINLRISELAASITPLLRTTLDQAGECSRMGRTEAARYWMSKNDDLSLIQQSIHSAAKK